MPYCSPDIRSGQTRQRRRLHLWLGAALAAVLILACAPTAGASSQTYFTITGHGWGHGIGMSQWGAYGYAKQGSSYKAILKHYYTGIGFTKISNPALRVRLRSGLSAVKVTCAKDFTVKDATSSPLRIAAGKTAVTTYVNGRFRVSAGSQSRDFSGAVTFTPTAGQLKILTATDTGQTGLFRGTLQVVRADGALMMINRVSLESYLRGVVPHEVSPSWPAEALKAQTCAARAYAERARQNSTKAWDLYCDVRSQVYSGVAREDSRTNAAVAATRGIVPSYKGVPIQAFYFSSSGGRTENIERAWETTALPYLKSVSDPYDHHATLHNWGPFYKAPATLAASLGSAVKGSLVAVFPVARGVSPRIVKAAIIGTSGTTYMHGSTLRTKLRLNSAWASFKSMSISPAAADKARIAEGESVTLSGNVYPRLAVGATVTLMYDNDGTWRRRSVATVRHTRALPNGYTATYSSYRITLKPSRTTTYYFVSGTAKTRQTTVTVDS